MPGSTISHKHTFKVYYVTISCMQLLKVVLKAKDSLEHGTRHFITLLLGCCSHEQVTLISEWQAEVPAPITSCCDLSM